MADRRSEISNFGGLGQTGSVKVAAVSGQIMTAIQS